MKMAGHRKKGWPPAVRKKMRQAIYEFHLRAFGEELAGVATKLPKSYDLAMEHLVDLRDVAARHGAEAEFSRRLAGLREMHSRKPAFIGRLRAKGL